MVVYWATRLRGFLKHVSTHTPGVQFVDNGRYYEVSGWKSKVKSKLIRSKMLNPIGMFQIINVSGKNCDCYGSFNRFLNTDKPYFIYLENPTALYHYTLGRIRTGAGKKRFQKCLENPNLKYIVCMSEACRGTFEKINMPVPKAVGMSTIYPMVPANTYADEGKIRSKSYQETLHCLYCVQGKRFYTKGGQDVLEAVKRLQDDGCNIHLTVITNLSDLREDTLALIRGQQQMTLHDFTFSYQQMEQIYAKTAVLLQPSSDDSYALTVLEAMKGGCAILGSQLYAIPEMVKDQENGILIEPKYRIFTRDNMPVTEGWGPFNKKRLASRPSPRYVGDIQAAVRKFYEDRDMLYRCALRSQQIANTKFGESSICEQWQAVWKAVKGDESL